MLTVEWWIASPYVLCLCTNEGIYSLVYLVLPPNLPILVNEAILPFKPTGSRFQSEFTHTKTLKYRCFKLPNRTQSVYFFRNNCDFFKYIKLLKTSTKKKNHNQNRTVFVLNFWLKYSPVSHKIKQRKGFMLISITTGYLINRCLTTNFQLARPV